MSPLPDSLVCPAKLASTSRMTSGLYDGPAAEGTLVSCPDEGEVTFRIKRHLWTPAEWQ